MAELYEGYDATRCRAAVATEGGWRWRQCSRKPWKDGWCRQHHPENKKARREESMRRYIEKGKRHIRRRNKAGVGVFLRWLQKRDVGLAVRLEAVFQEWPGDNG